MSTITDLIAANQYQSGYHGSGPKAPSFQSQDQKNAIALKLLQYKALVDKQQADAAIAKRKQELWQQVGAPQLQDKSTAGDVADIVDTGEAGDRAVDVTNDGTDSQGDTTSLTGLVSDFQAKINSNGDMVLGKTKLAKPYDETKAFSYARRLADQQIIQSGKSKRDISAADYSQMIRDNLPKAEEFLYGKIITPPGSSPSPASAGTATPSAPGAPPDAIVPQAVGPLDPRQLFSPKKYKYFGETPQETAGKKPDTFGFHIGQIEKSAKGRVRYIGNNKWQKVD